MLSLFEKMHGQFADGKPCPALVDTEALRHSVCDNLHRIFSAKRGMQEFVPLYGISDAAGFYRCALQTGDELRRQLQENVELFEPRLLHPRTVLVNFDLSRSRLVLRISGSLQGTRVNFEVLFGPDGRCWVA
jgi:type VI secretion system lysozyme-like protein